MLWLWPVALSTTPTFELDSDRWPGRERGGKLRDVDADITGGACGVGGDRETVLPQSCGTKEAVKKEGEAVCEEARKGRVSVLAWSRQWACENGVQQNAKGVRRLPCGPCGLEGPSTIDQFRFSISVCVAEATRGRTTTRQVPNTRWSRRARSMSSKADAKSAILLSPRCPTNPYSWR